MKDACGTLIGFALVVMMTTTPVSSDAPPANCTLRGHLVCDDETAQGLYSHYSLRRTIGPSGLTVDLALVPTDDSRRRALGLAYSRDAEVEVEGLLTTVRITPILILDSVREIP